MAKDTQYFIEKSRKIHGDKYDYSKVNYINNSTPVLIGYQGVFYEIRPDNHYKGSKIELMQTKWNRELFIQTSNEKHNNFYNYDKVEFNILKKKYVITCPNHGDFIQKGNEHVAGHGCPKCGKEAMSIKVRLSAQDIIQKIINKWGDYYKYHNLDENVTLKTMLIIECPKHGIYKKKVEYHLEYGCKGCSIRVKPEKIIENSEKFFKSAKKKWNNFYDYSKFVYVNSATKGIIVCPDHGEYEQSPNVHLKSSCRACGYERLSKKKRYKLDEFIQKSENIHGKLYDYTKVVYQNSRKKVIIICSKHGEFRQSAGAHLCGIGCPTCRESQGEKKIRVFLEENNIEFERQKKFDNCQHKLRLPFDFYIESKNLLIEFDGAQHFKVMEFFGGEEFLKNRKYLDNLKNKFCKENNINLLRISYKQIKSIEKILTHQLLCEGKNF